MAAQNSIGIILRRGLLRVFLWSLSAVMVCAILLCLAAWTGSSIPRNSGWAQPQSGITIMVETNGVHTGIVMPIVTPYKDWRETFPSSALPTASGEMPTHVAIGWGEKEVYLNTPEWSDLKPGTALRIIFEGGDAVMRVGHYIRPAPGPDHRALRLRPREYLRLAHRITAALPPLEPHETRVTYASFEPGAHNYDALGRYSLFNTCNQWVSDTLAYAGVKTGLWTPFAGGVMKWVPQPAA